MIVPERVEAFKKLIADTPVYVPSTETKAPPKMELVKLPNDLSSTVAAEFVRLSVVGYKYNRYDSWSIWHNGKYQHVEDPKEIRLHIRKFLIRCRVEKRSKKDKLYFEPLKKQTNGFVSDVLESIAAIPSVHLLPSKKAPCSLDGKLDPAYIIASNNLLIDISSNPHITHPITDQFYTRRYLSYDFDPTANEEIWYDFLVDIACSDVEIINLLQQWCGYLLLPTLKYHKFLLCTGNGSNGKGVFFDSLTCALGANNVSNVPLIKFDNPYALFGTYGKMANMCNENASTLAREGEAVLKEYVAGDKIYWEQKYKDAFFDYPTAKLMFATNEKPKIRDATDGIWRRLILVPFNAKFEGKSLDPDMGKKLQYPRVLATILNWMINGAKILLKNDRFDIPKVSAQAVEQYRTESDTVRMFFAEMLEVDDTEEFVIPCTWLHQQYQKWCEDNGFKYPVNNVFFGRNLAIVTPFKKNRTRYNSKRVMIYLGIKPQEETELAENLDIAYPNLH